MALVTADVGSIAKEVKEGAVKGAEMHAKEEERKRREAKTKSWIQKHWKKLAAAGIITPIAAYGGYMLFKVGNQIKGVTNLVGSGLAQMSQLIALPLKALEGITQSLDQFSIDKLGGLFSQLPELRNIIPELPKIETNLLESVKSLIPQVNTSGITKDITSGITSSISKTINSLQTITQPKVDSSVFGDISGGLLNIKNLLG